MAYDDWTPARVGCHWTRRDITISTIQDPDHPEARYTVVRHPGQELGYAPDFQAAVAIAEAADEPNGELPNMYPLGGGTR